MKNNIKLILNSIFGFLSLSLIKLLIILFFLLTDDSFYYLSKQKNIDYGELAMKLFYINIIPVFLHLFIGTYMFYKNTNSFIKTLVILCISLLLYYFFNFIDLLFFIENHRAKVYSSIILIIILMIGMSFFIRNKENRNQ
ncbi:hypothetical protein Q361_1012 [Flavobacterium croceum DSM 17960]|uniref:Uncharacterized protein n=1 Tax=Flavobacterium croceum DSM 17960 TaxID=1121886 RepID=A0A2S4NB21_9FLAO|nr:hypothetical protein Q361_1012 [Flavobacterium croceum DSM 17960]